MNAEDMGRFSKIINESRDFMSTIQELNDYIKVVKKEYEKNNENIINMMPEQIECRGKLSVKKKREFLILEDY
ncbi:MAG: hypothetical protein ACRC42_02275 [Mycoplasma sp.]